MFRVNPRPSPGGQGRASSTPSARSGVIAGSGRRRSAAVSRRCPGVAGALVCSGFLFTDLRLDHRAPVECGIRVGDVRGRTVSSPPMSTPTAAYSVTVRVRLDNRPGFARSARHGHRRCGSATSSHWTGSRRRTIPRRGRHRELLLGGAHRRRSASDRRARRCRRAVASSDRTFAMHEGGKIEVARQHAVQRPRRPVDGVHAGRRPGLHGHREHPALVHELTIKKNMVAIVTDGTAVLGLGDIGPAAAPAGHGGQGPPVQELRRRRRLPDLPRRRRKSRTTKPYTSGVQARIYPAFDRVLWQRGFHDRMLRNHDALEAARLYIEQNPARAVQATKG